jgi:hypothetical protein
MMNTQRWLLVSSLGLLACQNPTASEPAGVLAGTPVATTGDLAPASLHERPPLVVTAERVQASMPVSPADKLALEAPPTETSHTDAFYLVARNTAQRTHTIAVDDTQDAYLFLVPQLTDERQVAAALRGVQVLDPAGDQVNKRAPKAGQAEGGKVPMSMISLAGRAPGKYTVRLSDEAARVGFAFEVRQPKSPLAMVLKPSVVQHLHGGLPLSVDIALDEAGRTVSGAALTGFLVRPDGSRGPDLAFQEISAGRYRAQLSPYLTRADGPGAYQVDVQAAGKTLAGLPFQRQGRTGFHFGIPTARIDKVSATRIVRDTAGLIEAFEVDVDVESSSLDRLELSAVLAAVGPDGAEHAVAAAHVGAGLDRGRHQLTLRFDAAHAKLTRLEGTYGVRNLTLFSLGTDTMFHRVAVHPAHFVNIQRAQLAAPKEITPQLKGLIEAGLLAE